MCNPWLIVFAQEVPYYLEDASLGLRGGPGDSKTRKQAWSVVECRGYSVTSDAMNIIGGDAFEEVESWQ